jgi:hypothetical protein
MSTLKMLLVGLLLGGVVGPLDCYASSARKPSIELVRRARVRARRTTARGVQPRSANRAARNARPTGTTTLVAPSSR